MIFQLQEGKNLVLIREDYSDQLDFISCLCLHAYEAEKLRRKLLSPAGMLRLRALGFRWFFSESAAILFLLAASLGLRLLNSAFSSGPLFMLHSSLLCQPPTLSTNTFAPTRTYEKWNFLHVSSVSRLLFRSSPFRSLLFHHC